MSDRTWPLIIASGLLLVILVNAGFIWASVAHAPLVEPSYTRSVNR